MISEIPDWITARQQITAFRDVSDAHFEAACRKYGAPLAAQGIPEPQMLAKPPETALQAKISPLPAYLARAARNLPTASKEQRVATLRELDRAQINLF